MWKKTMTATVACLMTFSLAACGSSDEGKTAGVSGDIKVYTVSYTHLTLPTIFLV